MIGISAACVPCLKVLFEGVLKNLRSKIKSATAQTESSRGSYGLHRYARHISSDGMPHHPLGTFDDDNVWTGYQANSDFNTIIRSDGVHTLESSDRKAVIMKDESVSWETEPAP